MTLNNKHYLGSHITSRSTLDAVSLDQVRDFIRVDSDVCDNGLLELLREAATRSIEEYLNRSLLSSTAVAYFSAFDLHMRLPYGNVSAINSVKYHDTDEALQTVNSSNYQLVNHSTFDPFVWIDPDFSRPTLGDSPKKVEINYTVGYTSAADIPAPIVLCILNLCGDYYDDRSLLNSRTVPSKMRFALEPYKIFNI